MTAERLFDAGPALPPAPQDSADVRRTKRRAELLANGVHPTTRVQLRQPAGVETCGTCDHHEEWSRSKRTFHKCAKTPGGLTHGPGSDVRVGWPACAWWAPVNLLDGPPGGPHG